MQPPPPQSSKRHYTEAAIGNLHDLFPGGSQQNVTEDVGELVQSVCHARLMLDLPEPQEMGHQVLEGGLVVPRQAFDQVRQGPSARSLWMSRKQREELGL